MDNKSQEIEETLKEQLIFAGKVITLYNLTVSLPNGKSSNREIIRHPGAVAVIAEAKPGYILCVTQFRKATAEVLIEIPAGKLEKGESPHNCAIRELREETGYQAGRVDKVYEFYTSPGFADEKIYLFHASELEVGEQDLDDDEFVDVILLSRLQAQAHLDEGRIRDAKTIIALQWWLQRIVVSRV